MSGSLKSELSRISRRRRLEKLSAVGTVALLPVAIFLLNIPPGALAGCGTYGYSCTQTACFRAEVWIGQGYSWSWQSGSAWVYGYKGEEESIDLYIRTTMSSTVNGIEGWSMGVKHLAPTLIGINGGNFYLKAASEATGYNSVSTVQAGSAPDFLGTRVWTCGQTQGVVIDCDSTHHTTGPNSGLVTTLACYRLTFPDNFLVHQVTLDFTDDVGLPPVKNLVVRSGQSVVPCKDKLTINVQQRTYSPTPTYCPFSQMSPYSCEGQGGGGGGVGPAVTCGVASPFQRGNANDDHFPSNLSDALTILLYLFVGGTNPPCADAADADDSGVVLITDAIYLLRYLFQGGPALPPPYDTCGLDPTPDGLGCLSSSACPGEPASLALHAPGDGSTNVSQDVQLICRRLWPGNEAVVYPAFYVFQVSTSSNFAAFTATSEAQEYTTFFPYNLDPGTTYYWRVIATDSAAPSPEVYESDTWSFTTRAAGSVRVASPNGTATFAATGCTVDNANPSLDCSLAEANKAPAGSIIFLKSGTYSTQVQPQNDGTAAAPIRYQPYEGPNPGNTGDVIISPSSSGTQGRGFRFSFDNASPDDTQRSYITIDGRFKIDPQSGARKRRILFQPITSHWGDVNGSHNVVRNCELKPYAAGNTVFRGIYFHSENSDNNVVTNNDFDKGCVCVGSGGADDVPGDCGSNEQGSGDAINITGGSFNVIQNNVLHNIGHSGLEFSHNTSLIDGEPVTPPMGERNVIRGNTFFEVHNAFGVTGSDNLVEYNTVHDAGCGYGKGAGCYVKVDGMHNIVRFNLFVDDDCLETDAQGNCIRRTFEEDMVNIGLEESFFNRFYSNVVYGGTSGPGLLLKQDQNLRFAGQTIRDNAYLNNAVSNTCLGTAGGYRSSLCEGTFTQVVHGFQQGQPTEEVYNRFRGNLIWGSAAENETIYYRICLTQNLGTGLTLATAIGGNTCSFVEGLVFDATNSEQDPDDVFVDRTGPAFANRNFRLKDTAEKLIDRAQALAVIQSTANGGAKLNLAPQVSSVNGNIPTSSFFFDGGGTDLGDVGDVIRVVHQLNSDPANLQVLRYEHFITRVTKVYAVQNGLSQLDVDPPLPQVGVGDAVHPYFFNGCAPDVGRYESQH